MNHPSSSCQVSQLCASNWKGSVPQGSLPGVEKWPQVWPSLVFQWQHSKLQAQGPVCKAARDWRPNSSSWATAPWCQEPAGWPVWVGRLSFCIKSVNVDIVVRFPDAEDVNGLTKTAPPPPFVPKFCHLDKKVSSSRHSLCEKTIYIWYIIMKVIQVLRFFGHFSEEIPAGVGSEGSRVRNVQVSFCHLYPNNTRAWIGSTSPQGVHLVCQTVSSNSRQSPILPCPVVIQSSL